MRVVVAGPTSIQLELLHSALVIGALGLFVFAQQRFFEYQGSYLIAYEAAVGVFLGVTIS
jgi:hypothetical protein